jgi:hypothetical protein
MVLLLPFYFAGGLAGKTEVRKRLLLKVRLAESFSDLEPARIDVFRSRTDAVMTVSGKC